jgi:hypothetical protein
MCPAGTEGLCVEPEKLLHRKVGDIQPEIIQMTPRKPLSRYIFFEKATRRQFGILTMASAMPGAILSWMGGISRLSDPAASHPRMFDLHARNI